MGRHNSTRVDEGRKCCNLLAIKMQGTNRSGEGEEEPAMHAGPVFFVVVVGTCAFYTKFSIIATPEC